MSELSSSTTDAPPPPPPPPPPPDKDPTPDASPELEKALQDRGQSGADGGSQDDAASMAKAREQAADVKTQLEPYQQNPTEVPDGTSVTPNDTPGAGRPAGSDTGTSDGPPNMDRALGQADAVRGDLVDYRQESAEVPTGSDVTPDVPPELAEALSQESESLEAPGTAPDEAPAATPDEIPAAPDEAPAATPDEVPDAAPDQVVEPDPSQYEGQDPPQPVADGERPLTADPVGAEELADLQADPGDLDSEQAADPPHADADTDTDTEPQSALEADQADAADTITLQPGPEPAEQQPDAEAESEPAEPAPDTAPEPEPAESPPDTETEPEPEPVDVDLEGGMPVGRTDNATVQQAFEAAELDPATADLVVGADPLGGMSPSEYQAKYWDPTASTPYGKGEWDYPPNDGADRSGLVTTKTFVPGEAFDRFGPESGSFASPEGTSWAERSLPPTSLVSPRGDSTYHLYEVSDKWGTDPPPVVVTESTIAPTFGQQGGGIQYKFEAAPGSSEKMSFGWLLDHGYITEVSP